LWKHAVELGFHLMLRIFGAKEENVEEMEKIK
jgi:hypothetical protein